MYVEGNVTNNYHIAGFGRQGDFCFPDRTTIVRIPVCADSDQRPGILNYVSNASPLS